MPHAMRGTHAFRPSEQSHGAIANTTIIGANDSVPNPSGSTAAGVAAMGLPLHTNNGPDSSDDDEVGLPPTTPIRPSSTVSSATTSKCRRSVLGDDASTTTYSKWSRNSATGGAAALHGIKNVMADFNLSVCNGPLGQPCHHRRSSAEHRIEATALLQQREDLTADQAITFADLFEQDMAKADTYMGLIRVDVRKLWVERQLVKLGFPTVSAEAS